METLSSGLTFFYKYVFTTLWSAGFGLGTVGMMFSDSPEARSARPIFALCWVVGSAFLWWGCGRLKRVQLAGTTLHISNYRDEIAVPAADIAEVKQNRWINIRPITIVFRKETPFGRSIMFMPPLALFRLLVWREDQVVERLRRLGQAPTATSRDGTAAG